MADSFVLLDRPEVLSGATYKVKPPTYDHAVYVTINHTVLDDGSKRPIEVFINSKAMESFQWVSLMTRNLSALFRQKEFPAFVIEEMEETFDPKGGYFVPGTGVWVNGVVSHIGLVIRGHCGVLGVMPPRTKKKDK